MQPYHMVVIECLFSDLTIERLLFLVLMFVCQYVHRHPLNMRAAFVYLKGTPLDYDQCVHEL